MVRDQRSGRVSLPDSHFELQMYYGHASTNRATKVGWMVTRTNTLNTTTRSLVDVGVAQTFSRVGTVCIETTEGF